MTYLKLHSISTTHFSKYTQNVYKNWPCGKQVLRNLQRLKYYRAFSDHSSI